MKNTQLVCVSNLYSVHIGRALDASSLRLPFQDITHNLSCDMLAQGRHDAIRLRKRLAKKLSLSLSFVQCFRICSKTAATRTCENIWPAVDEYSLHIAALQTIHLDIFAREKARRGLVRCVYFALKTFFFFFFFVFFFSF